MTLLGHDMFQITVGANDGNSNKNGSHTIHFDIESPILPGML
jgi:hypothetical protein